MDHALLQLVKDQKNGVKRGIASLCSANRFVLEAAMKNAAQYGEHLLIEATANQVNQFGGYTGMKPQDFADFVYDIAKTQGFDSRKIILGGDHLGPLTWTDEAEETAMAHAHELIRSFVLAGFTKIHIDTSMKLRDDDRDARLSDAVIARRGAALCKTAEEAFVMRLERHADAVRPVYVIGSEVPIPGGAQEEEEGVSVTKPEDFRKTVAVFKKEFEELGLSEAFGRVIAVVVQPGVEFGDAAVFEYDREKASALTDALKAYPSMVFEGHSTDYQTPQKLRHMVEDLFCLADIERELKPLYGFNASNLKAVLESEMLDKPGNWMKHYHGSTEELTFKRKYSFSDRCRYYLPVKAMDGAIARLIQNLSQAEIPLSLLSQYMPIQYTKIRAGLLRNAPVELIYDRIINCIDEYAYGCGRKAGQPDSI
jgi:D-tagatose-1,6-bisphosphate aldolase subunit GatZ/KbaZ